MKILVVDDEPLARERIVRLLGKLDPAPECLEAASGARALQLVAEHSPDLLLLDIRMPGMDGIEVAGQLDKLEQPPAIIFCTAYDEYALQALEHQAVAYLLKPVRSAELSRALERAGRVNRAQLASLRDDEPAAEPGQVVGRSHVSSQTHRGVAIMPVAEIRCFLAEQKYVTACSADAEILIPDTLKDLEQEFEGQFLRVHRNALVAVQYIERLDREDGGNWQVVLSGLRLRPTVSRRHLGEVKQRLLEA